MPTKKKTFPVKKANALLRKYKPKNLSGIEKTKATKEEKGLMHSQMKKNASDILKKRFKKKYGTKKKVKK